MARDDVQSLAHDPRRQHAEDGVWEEIERDGHGRLLLDAEPELDGVELPRAAPGSKGEEMRDHEWREALGVPQNVGDQRPLDAPLDQEEADEEEKAGHDERVRVRTPLHDRSLSETEKQTDAARHDEPCSKEIKLPNCRRFRSYHVGDGAKRRDGDIRGRQTQTRDDGVRAKNPREMGFQGAALDRAQPEAKRRGRRHGGEDAVLPQSGFVHPAQDAHGAGHQHSDRQTLHSAHEVEQHRQAGLDREGADEVPDHGPGERPDHDHPRRGQIAQAARDHDREAQRRGVRAQQPRQLAVLHVQRALELLLVDDDVAQQEREPEQADRAHADEGHLSRQTSQLGRHALVQLCCWGWSWSSGALVCNARTLCLRRRRAVRTARHGGAVTAARRRHGAELDVALCNFVDGKCCAGSIFWRPSCFGVLLTASGRRRLLALVGDVSRFGNNE